MLSAASSSGLSDGVVQVLANLLPVMIPDYAQGHTIYVETKEPEPVDKAGWIVKKISELGGCVNVVILLRLI